MLDLVQRVSLRAGSDDEAVAIVTRLVNSRRVRLIGNFAGRRIPIPHAA